VLRLLLGIFLCVFVGTLLTLLVRSPNGVKPTPTLGRTLVSLVCFQGASLALVWRFLREQEVGWAEAFGFRNQRGRALLLGGLGVAVFFPVGQLLHLASFKLLTWLHLDPEGQAAVELLRGAAGGPALIAIALITVVLVPLAEELVFRGILYPAIKYAGFPRLALWGTSLLFATIHFNLASFPPLLVLALVLAWLYEKTDNLLAPIAAHGLFNAVNLGLLFLSEEFSRTLPAPP